MMLRFRLRTLLLLVAVAGVVFGSVGRELHHGLRQKRVIEDVQRRGGLVQLRARKSMVSGVLRRIWSDEYSADVYKVFWGPRSEEELDLLHGLTELTQLSLSGTTVTDAALGRLVGLRQLHELGLSEAAITEQVLKPLAQLPSLRRLYLQNCSGVTADTILAIQGANPYLYVEVHPNQRFLPTHNLPQTESLTLTGPLTTDAMLAASLKDARILTQLRLHNCGVTDEGLRSLRGLAQLTSLDLLGNGPVASTGGQFTDQGLEHIGQLSNLTHLSVWNCQLTDQGVHSIGRLTKLDFLELNSGHITDAGLRHLRPLQSLKWLYLHDTAITDEGMCELQGLKKLRLVSLNRARVTDRGLADIARLSSLEHLFLCGTCITDDGISQLAGMKSLRFLDVSETQLTDRSVEDLCSLSLEELRVYRTQITERGVERLKARFGESAVRSVNPLTYDLR